MSSIKLNYPHEKSVDDLRSTIDDYAEQLRDKYDVQSKWLSDTKLDLKRNGLSGNVSFDESSVNVDLKLGFMLAMFKSNIEDGIKEHLVKKLS